MEDDGQVVISGIGMVTPLGATAAESAEAWVAGKMAARRRVPELAGTRLETAEVADLPDLNREQRFPNRRMLKYMSEGGVLGCLAAHEAIEEAAVQKRFRPERVGLFAATGLAAARLKDTLPMVAAAVDADGSFSPALFGKSGLPAANPLISFRILANMSACVVSIIEGIRGPSYVFTPWEGQGGAALVEAWRAVAAGEVDAAVAGGSDSAAQASSFVFLRRRGILGDDELPASGAAYVVLERAATAQHDGVADYGRILDLSLKRSDGPLYDPLAPQMGRTFAAAPAMLLGLASFLRGGRHANAPQTLVSGVDGQEFCFVLEAAP